MFFNDLKNSSDIRTLKLLKYFNFQRFEQILVKKYVMLRVGQSNGGLVFQKK